MSLLRRVRAEVSGALRSVRYDMGRRPVEPPAGGPDVTSTGMNTFGGPLRLDDDPSMPSTAPATHRRPRAPRQAAAVSALAALTVLGAAGVYLAVVNGLGSLLTETPASADTFPPRPAVTSPYTPNAGIGGGPAAAARRPALAPTAAAGATIAPAPPAPGGPAPVAVPDDPGNASPIRTVSPTDPECPCGFPPVPTPTAPSATSPSPSLSGRPSDSPQPSDSAGPSPSETSATPSDSAEPRHTRQARHRRRHG